MVVHFPSLTYRNVELDRVHRYTEGPGILVPPQHPHHRFGQILELVSHPPFSRPQHLKGRDLGGRSLK